MGHSADASEKNRTAETRYRALVEMATDAIVAIDREGRILLMNRAAEETLGYDRGEAAGKTLEALIVPEQSRDLFRACLSGESCRDKEIDLARKDTSLFSAALSFSPEIKPEGDSERMIIIRDMTARKRAEEALQSVALFPIQNPEPVLRIHRDGSLLFSNPAAGPVLAEWRTANGIRSPDGVRQVIEEALIEGVSRDLEIRIADREFSFVVNPIRESNYVNLYGRDVTDRKRAEDALRASEMRMKAVTDHLPVGVWFADETGKIVYGNEAGRKIWAGARYVDPAEFHVYRAWWTDTGKPLGPEEWAVARAVRHGETSLNEILDIECFDGTRKTILNSAVPLKSDGGGLLGVVILNEDITERIGIEQALRRSEARYRSYIEVTGQMGWTTNADGAIVEDIPGWREYTGQTFDEMRGWGWSRALHPDDLEITLAVWRKAVEEKQSYETEYRLRRHDGVYRHFLARGLPVLQEDGSVREWVGTCIDITELHRVQEDLKISKEALRLANEELEQRVRERTAELMLTLEDLERSRDDLRRLASELVLTEERERKKISVTLHDEVAQTLAAARMRIDLLRSRPGDDDSRRTLDEAQQLLVQAIRETRSLMTDISNPVLYDMGLRVAVQSLTEEMNARQGISFESFFGGGLRGLGQDMEVMLFQVVKELAQNVVKHSGARKASIRVVEERNDVKVVVADDGLGFEVGNFGSVGLDGGFGLFSIRERVKSYRGKIKIKSEPGKGSEVIVTLPKKAAGVAASRKTGKKKETI